MITKLISKKRFLSSGSRGAVETAIDLVKSGRASSWENSVKDARAKVPKWEELSKHVANKARDS